MGNSGLGVIIVTHCVVSAVVEVHSWEIVVWV